jgi:AraC family transcriptional regulator
MNQSDCPYCSLAKKKGELFCSRHGSGMAELKSGIFYINQNSFEECDWHITRLSLNFNLDEKQTYRTSSREHTVSPEKYLLLNEGQSFKTFARYNSPTRMVTIAFQVGLAERLLQGLTTDCLQLLDDPFQSSNGKAEFIEKAYPLDTALTENVAWLAELNDDAVVDQTLENLLLEILQRQLKVREEILSIRKSKPSTRLEVYRRLHWSLEYLQENFSTDLAIDQLARVACLSTFHYKRLFTELFHIPPYQYLIKLRLEKACALLCTERNVRDICVDVGWKDPSSFSRLFKREFCMTPEQYRQGKRVTP